MQSDHTPEKGAICGAAEPNWVKLLLFAVLGYLHASRSNRDFRSDAFGVFGIPFIFGRLAGVGVDQRVIDLVQELDEITTVKDYFAPSAWEASITRLTANCLDLLDDMERPKRRAACPMLRLFARSGINIFAGASFKGEKDPGSAFGGVLLDLAAFATLQAAEVVARLRSEFETAECRLHISNDEVQMLMPLLERYSAELESQIGPTTDPFDQITRDEIEGVFSPAELKFGAGLGWRHFCVRNLLQAFKVASTEARGVALSW